MSLYLSADMCINLGDVWIIESRIFRVLLSWIERVCSKWGWLVSRNMRASGVAGRSTATSDGQTQLNRLIAHWWSNWAHSLNVWVLNMLAMVRWPYQARAVAIERALIFARGAANCKIENAAIIRWRRTKTIIGTGSRSSMVMGV